MKLPTSPLIIIPLVVASALFMENLDGTVIATSLPAIGADLGVDPISLKLTFTSYLLSLAIFIPISGWCADRFGSRTVFRAAIGVFTLGSVACAFSDSLGGFILARAFQGLGGAMMVPVGRLVLLRSVPKNQLVSAMAYLTVPALLGPVIGPPLGGFITTYFHWRWIFWINVPIGLLGIALATIFIPQLREEEPARLDFVGFILSGIGLSTLVSGMSVTGLDFVPVSVVLLLLAIGITFIALYVRHARRITYPIIDLGLLAIPTFRTSVTGGFLFRAGIGALPFLLPLMLQLNFGLTPFQSGSLTFAASAGSMLMKVTARPILRQFGFRNVLFYNGMISAAFLAMSAFFTVETPHLLMFAILLVGGFFRSLQFTSLNTIAYADIDPHFISRATSFSSVVQQLSASVGVAMGALTLETAELFRGETSLKGSDFTVAFLVISCVSLLSVLMHRHLAADAGSEISGHAVKVLAER